MNARLFQRYLGKSIWQATGFVLCGFLSMFLFFDFLAEMDEIGLAGYRLNHAILVVLLGVPSRVVELAPIAALIGTIWALSQSASNSEFTVFRVSGLLPSTAIKAMLRIGLPMVVITALFSEVVVPFSEDLRGGIRDGSGSGQMRSGLWIRDMPESASGPSRALRFVNAGKFTPEQVLERVQIYDFDERQRLVTTFEAGSGHYISQSGDRYQWELRAVRRVDFAADGSLSQKTLDRLVVTSMLSPEMLGALVTNPDRMSSMDLYRYVNYLKQNKQQSDRYEIALWKRLVYPFVIWVMMLLALPAAFIQARAGAVGSRVFAGILVGVGFHLLNSLFSHLGVLNTWPAPIMALLPSLLGLSVAAVLFYRVQYR
jgi:lipopolysaccharide export system permease protein